MLFFWTLYSWRNPEKIKCIMVSTKILSSTTVFNIDNKKCFLLLSKSAYYRMIFEVSCDTEDWYDECIHYNRKQLFLNCNNI